MKRIFIVLICGIIAAIVAVAPATAYAIDGDLSDWGLAKLKADDWSLEGTWLPNGHVTYIVEDNYNPGYGVSPSGVHIKGIGSNYFPYYEAKAKMVSGAEVPEPYGGEKYDLEALYFDQDDDYIYIAIVTSLKPDGVGDLRPGDLALNVDLNYGTGDLGYEYGIKVRNDGATQGDIIKNPIWQKVGYLIPIRPDIIVGGPVIGTADLVFTNTWLTKMDNNYDPMPYDNYVIEMAIPKTSVGLATGDRVLFSSIMYADNCINEHIFVPEFPTIAISLAMIIGLISAVFILREKDE